MPATVSSICSVTSFPRFDKRCSHKRNSVDRDKPMPHPNISVVQNRLTWIGVLMAFGVLGPLSASAGSFREDQVTTQELAAALDIHTRKIIFAFETPVYAKADFVQVKSGQ